MPSPDQFLDHRSVHVGQSERATGKSERQSLMVDAQLVQDGRLDVMDVNGIFDRMKSQVVGFADRLSGPHATAGHPHRERLRVMVATE